MYPKLVVNLSLACIWATFEFFTQFGPLPYMPFSFWFAEGIVLWLIVFWLVDAITTHFPPPAPHPPKGAFPRQWAQVVVRWVLKLYLWIPLFLLGYFLVKDASVEKIIIELLYLAKLIAGALVIFLLRQYLVKRYCADADKNKN